VRSDSRDSVIVTGVSDLDRSDLHKNNKAEQQNGTTEKLLL